MDQYLHLSEKFKADEHKIEIKELKTLVFSFITFYCIMLYLSSITKIVFALCQLLKAWYKNSLNFIFKIFQLMWAVLLLIIIVDFFISIINNNKEILNFFLFIIELKFVQID